MKRERKREQASENVRRWSGEGWEGMRENL
jgi:hypothetical protein